MKGMMKIYIAAAAFIVAVATAMVVKLCPCQSGSVIIDKKGHSVSFEVVATGCDTSANIEFLLVGPDSDRGYEALFYTVPGAAEIADAFEKAGIPRGTDYDNTICRLWPTGNKIEIEPAFDDLVKEINGVVPPPIIYTGGARSGEDNIPEAETNMPCAVFALYNCSQSLLQMDDSLDQSGTYGCFHPKTAMDAGERMWITLRWCGTNTIKHVDLEIKSGGLAEAVATLKKESAECDLDVLATFPAEMTLKEASDCAAALAIIDSPRVKINGCKKGELYYRAYMPLEQWRDRKERLMQPPEVRFAEDGTIVITEIIEDWSVEDSPDAVLSFKEHRCGSFAEAGELLSQLGERTMSALVFAAPDTKLEKLFLLRSATSDDIINWYVFTEQ